MNEIRRPRRPPEGGYARGDETRRKIIEAAIYLFGQHGFAGASTRDIAARAGVNAPALQYYFENKEGLYRACAESLADEAWGAFEPQVARCRAVLEHDSTIDELIDAFVDLQGAVAGVMFRKGSMQDKRLFLTREQSGGEPAIGSQILRARVREPLNRVSIAMLARITQLPEDDPLAVVRMFSLFGQFMPFHFARESTLSMLGWSEIDGDRIAYLKACIGEQTRVLLAHWRREARKAGNSR
jgi:AcrR family transcriptional regulator